MGDSGKEGEFVHNSRVDTSMLTNPPSDKCSMVEKISQEDLIISMLRFSREKLIVINL